MCIRDRFSVFTDVALQLKFIKLLLFVWFISSDSLFMPLEPEQETKNKAKHKITLLIMVSKQLCWLIIS